MIRRIRPFLGVTLLLTASLARAEQPAETELAADEKLLKSAGIAADGPALLDFLSKRTPNAERRKELAELVKQLDSNQFAVRQNASQKLEEAGPPALPYLRAALKGSSLETNRRASRCIEVIETGSELGVPGAAARVLKVRKPKDAARVLLDYVPFADNDVVEEAVLDALLTLGVQDGAVDPLLVSALEADHPARRAAACLVLGRHGTEKQRGQVHDLLAKAESQVRLRGAQGLVAARDKKAVPALFPLLTEAPMEVAAQAEDLLQRLAGEKPPPVALGETEAERRKCREGWEAWWKVNAEKLDLAAAVDPPLGSLSSAARTSVKRFLDALLKGDKAAITKTTDVPFCLDGLITLKTRKELDELLGGATGNDKTTFTLERVGGIGELERRVKKETKQKKDIRGGEATLLGFLGGLKKPEIRVVYMRSKGEAAGEQYGALIVRTTAGQARVIGYAELSLPTK